MAINVGQTEILIQSLASGSSRLEAATAAGCSVRTVARRLEQPEFQQRLTEARQLIFGEASATLASSLKAASAELVNLLQAKGEMTRLGAARSIWEIALRAKEGVDWENRMTALEAIARIDQ